MKVRWRRIGLGIVAALVLVACAVVVLWKEGYVDRWARAEVIRQVEKATGGRVDLGALHIRLLPFTVTLDQFTIHGHETPAEPPFVHIDQVKVGVDMRALLRGKVILGEVAVERPAVYVHIDKDGHSNVPAPPHRAPSKPWHEQLFSITIDRLHLDDGIIRLNDRRLPLTADGGRFTFGMNYSAPEPGHDFYHGEIAWKDMHVAARKWVPFPSTWSAKFTIGRRGGSLDQFRLELPHSSIEARADWPDWTQRQMEAHYRVRLNLDDIRTLMRKPHAPLGTVETTGDFRYAPGGWNLHGYYSARDIAIGFQWFHAKGMNSRGTILADSQGLEIPDFQAWALGGQVSGRVHMNIHTLEFTADTQSRKISLAQLFAALQNRDFPIQNVSLGSEHGHRLHDHLAGGFPRLCFAREDAVDPARRHSSRRNTRYRADSIQLSDGARFGYRRGHHPDSEHPRDPEGNHRRTQFQHEHRRGRERPARLG